MQQTDAEKSPKKPYRPKLKQPLEIVNIPDALLQKQTCVTLAGTSPATLDRRVKAGTFPAPIKDGARCVRWRAGDVKAWLQAQGLKAEEAVPA